MPFNRRHPLRQIFLRGGALVLTCLGRASALGGQQGAAPLGPPLAIGVEDAADLWSRPNGTGFANEVVTAAFRAARVPIHLTVVPYARCKQLVREGAVAACFSMSRDHTSADAVRFPSVPLFVCHTELLENSSRPLGSAQLSMLPRGTRVGIVLGYEYPAVVDSALHNGRIVLETSPSEAILMRKLAAGRVDGALMNINEMKSLPYVMAVAGLAEGIRSRGRVGTLESFIGFSVRNAEWEVAVSKFESGMRTIRANGEFAAITRRWADTSRAVIRGNSPKGRGE